MYILFADFVLAHDLFLAHPTCQSANHSRDRHACPSDDRFAVLNLRVNNNSIVHFILHVHDSITLPNFQPVGAPLRRPSKYAKFALVGIAASSQRLDAVTSPLQMARQCLAMTTATLPRRLFEQPALHGVGDGLRAVTQVQFLEDVFQMILDSVFRDVQFGGDIAVG